MVDFSNFQRLDPPAREVTLELLRQADHHPPSFMSFVYRWMAFNGWMSAVTLEETDAAMINALAAAPSLIAAYDGLFDGNPNFGQKIDTFTALWPVLSVSSVRAKLGYDAFSRYDRATLLARCAAANVRLLPIGWAPGDRASWAQVLRAMYQVRCNLFHGEKSPQSMRDRDLVSASDEVLVTFLRATNCFDWNHA